MVRWLILLVIPVIVGACAHHKHGEKGCGDSCKMEKSKKHDCKSEGGKDGECKMSKERDSKKCDCKGGDKKRETKLESGQKIGASDVTIMNGHVHMGAAPKDLKDFAAAKERGIQVVVDLREGKEFNKARVQKTVAAQGMTYVHIPMSKNGAIQSDAIEKIELAIHKDGKGENTWIYCASGNRAAAWMAIHAVKVHQETPEKAIALAETAGLKADMKAKVEAFLKPTVN